MVVHPDADLGTNGSISTALKDGENLLRQAKLDSPPRLDAEALLQSVLGVDRTSLYLNSQNILAQKDAENYRCSLERRLNGEPLQFIVGWASFYWHKFYVGRGSFIPRFDSEAIVENALKLLTKDCNQPSDASHKSTMSIDILDLCCGCGAIGLSIAAELPGARITLLDVELFPLDYSKLNAESLKLSDRVEILCRDALEEFPAEWRGRFDLIVANPPYIPAGDIPGLSAEVREGEPRSALTDGGDGLSFYRRWSESFPGILKPGGRFIVEIGDGAAEAVLEILGVGFDNLKVINDLSGNARAVTGTVSC